MTDPGPVTERQRAMLNSLRLPFDNLAALSVTERSTGRQRAVIVAVDSDGEEVVMRPIALLLDRGDDEDLFDPPLP